MIKKIIMPSAGQTTDTATVTRVCVKVGDKVERGQVVAEVETDKATLPVESFATGYICGVYVEDFQIVDAGSLLFEVGDEADAEAAKSGKRPGAESVASDSAATGNTVAQAADTPAVAADNSHDMPAAAPVAAEKSTLAGDKKPSAGIRVMTSKTAVPALASADRYSAASVYSSTPAMPSAKRLAAQLGVDLARVTPSNGSFIKPADVRACAAPATVTEHYDFGALTEYLRYLVEDFGVPAVGISVRRGHRELFRAQAGTQTADSDAPLREDAQFYMYSCSKPVTCVAALKLLEQGKILLTDSVSEYLPEFADIEYSRGSYTQPTKHTMRVLDLFTMSSGLNYNLATANIDDAIRATDGRCPTRELVRAFARSPLNFDPSTQWLYGLSHDVLAALVEQVSGVKFSEFVNREIFTPLGMKDSHYHLSEVDTDRMAGQYRYNEKQKKAQPIPLTNSYVPGPEYESGGAGLISTLEDMSRFTDMLACGGKAPDGTRILAPSTVQLMHTNQLDAVRLDDFHRAFPQFSGYGYGLGVRTHIDRTFGSISPLGEFGWAGAAGAFMVADDTNQLSVFYVQHMLNSQERIIHPRLRNIVYACMGL